MPGITIKLPFIDFHLSTAEWNGVKEGFTNRPLQHGPCLILSRDTGLALDAGSDAKAGAHTCLWQVHAAPWQQWRINSAGRGKVEIVSEHTGLKLTTMGDGSNWGETWLECKPKVDMTQQWRIKPTDDRVAFLVENAGSPFALDAGQDGENGRDPHVWESHWAAWQQWMIVRLPLT